MSDALYLSPEFSDLWQDKNPFVEVEKITGEVYREVDGRTTLRFELNGKSYFLKIHRGIGWKEIVKNVMQFKMPVLGAENEWKAIDKLKSIDVDTMTYVAYGKTGSDPSKQLSFIITEDLVGCISLEDYFLGLSKEKENEQLSKALVEKLAFSVKTMHQHGVNHRDLYVCHFLFDPAFEINEQRLHVIDLHRAQIREKVPFRWLVKDVSSVVFSLREIKQADCYLGQFVELYGKIDDKMFWKSVSRKADSLLLKEKSR